MFSDDYPVMHERLESLARDMRGAYDSLRQKARDARAKDPGIVMKVQKAQLDISVGAVDGGLLAGRMHGADIVMARAAGVIFKYQNSRLETHSYHPSKNPPPEFEVRDSLEEHEALAFRSLIRLKHELSCAISLIETYRPQLMLMDGSLLPLPADRPAEDSSLRPLYEEVLGLFSKLFSASSAGGCLLCGVIKDSRSKKLSKELGAGCTDTVLCGFLLEEGERTKELGYFEGKAPNKDVGSLGERIKVFYIRPSKNDLPLRVEVLGGDVANAASLILTLSSISENFAYPAVLIEADMRAALDPAELERIESSLSALSGLRPLRRNSRPFR